MGDTERVKECGMVNYTVVIVVGGVEMGVGIMWSHGNRTLPTPKPTHSPALALPIGSRKAVLTIE